MSQQNKNKQAPEIRRSVKKMSIICMCAISVVLTAQRKGDRTPPLQQLHITCVCVKLAARRCAALRQVGTCCS